MTKNRKSKILLPNGRYVERVIRSLQIGNFIQGYVTINNSVYTVGNGDEYLRGEPEFWKLSYSTKHNKYVAYSKEDIQKWDRVWINFRDTGLLPCSDQK